MNGLNTIIAINEAAARKARGLETKTPSELRAAARAERASRVAAGQRRARAAS